MTRPRHLLPAAAVLAALSSHAGAAQYNFEAGTKYNLLGQTPQERVSASPNLAEGHLDTSLLKGNRFELRLYTGLVSVGPITEAYMTSSTRPVPGEVSLMPFLQTLSTLQPATFRLSPEQARHAIDGDWMVVVRSSGYAAARFTGAMKECTHERGRRVCTIAMSRSPSDTRNDEPNGEAEMFTYPFEPTLSDDPATGRLCLTVKLNWNKNERKLVSVALSTPGAAERTAAIGAPDHSGETVDACAPADATLKAAFAASHVQVTVNTASAPGTEYISRFTFVDRLPDRPIVGRHPFGPPLDLH